MEYGCKSTTDFADLAQLCTGERYENATAMSDAHRKLMLEFLAEVKREKTGE